MFALYPFWRGAMGYNRGAMRWNQPAVAAGGLLGLGLAFYQLHQWSHLELYAVETIAAGLAAGVIYFVTLFALARTEERRAALWLILAGALLFRLLLFPLQPALSDDLYRYRWEGRVQSAGWNPYAVAPEDPRVAELREEGWERIPGRDIPSIYPPLAELTYRAGYALAAGAPLQTGLILMKMPFLAADLGIVALLAWWLRRTGGSNAQLAIYAWNPLVVVEFAASGHADSLVALAVLAACLALHKEHHLLSTQLLAAGALIKIFPAALFPLWLRRQGWPRTSQSWWGVLGAAALAAACAWPFRSALGQAAANMAYYESRWQHNNASLYTLASWFSGSAEFAAGLAAGIVAGLALWAAARKLEPVRAAILLLGTLLLLSPNAFSWYFTWLVPLLALVPLRDAAPWLLLTVTQFLSYHVLLDYHATGAWQFQPFYLWLTYAPFFALLAWQWLLRQDVKGTQRAAPLHQAQ